MNKSEWQDKYGFSDEFMVRLLKKIFFIFGSVALLIFILSKLPKSPQIIFHKSLQHNTIGELPIVELADDRVFAENDGEETFSTTEHCYSVLSKECEKMKEYKLNECQQRAQKICEYTLGDPSCDLLIKEKFGLCFTCWGTFK